MRWTEQLANGIKDAFSRKTACRIAVHSDAQVELGKSAAKRLATSTGGNPSDLTFEVIPANEQEQHPIGCILV